MVSTRPELPHLETGFLTALKSNDIGSLTQFGKQFSQLTLQLEQAASTSLLSQDEVEAHLCLSHNVFVASSYAEQAQLVADELSAKLTKKLNFLAPLPPHPPAPSPLPSKQPVAEDDSSSPTSHTILKKWSQTHMSYLYPTRPQLRELAAETSLDEDQVVAWFRNARGRSDWTKLYGLKGQVDKNREKLQLIIEEYQSLKRLMSPEDFAKIVAERQTFQYLVKIFRWFATGPPAKKPVPTSSVRPWVREVLSNTLASFRQGAAGLLDSSKQLLPSFSPRSTSPSSTSASSPTATSPECTTASTVPSSLCGSSSDRSASPEAPSSRASASSSSPSPVLSPFNLPAMPSFFPNSPCNGQSSISLAASSPPLSSSSSSSLSPVISPFDLSQEPPSFPNLPSNDRPADLTHVSSSCPAPSTTLLSPIFFPLNLPLSAAAFPQSPGNSQFADALDTSSSGSSSPNSWQSPIFSPSNIPTVATSLPNSKPPTPDSFPSSLSPFLSPLSPSPELASPFAASSSLPLCLPANKSSYTILSSSPSESISDRHSPFPSISSSYSDATQQSILSGQFDDAPEDL
ncbi:hypothetical protein PCANC_13529 [Puccinia coronata f. sp. avenae]|uniref:Homeobox domain-containing protein n=1 Tax=Puccinia coronata f. sp. avenae TaxID=200324 RepID=A0A2N5USP6_9BASI|nr:hypothetical protein PCANC_13529 [Puccinia coronata f. sp. avenae]